MLPRSTVSPSSVASTSRQCLTLLRPSALPRSHAGDAARLRLPSAAAASSSSSSSSYSSSSSSSSSSSLCHPISSTSRAPSASSLFLPLSSQTASRLRRSFSSSSRKSAPGASTSSSISEEETRVPAPSQKAAEETQAWFQKRFPGVSLPDKVLLQTITHESFNYGMSTEGHNRRLSFIGRRAMMLFMVTFLHANVSWSARAASLLEAPHLADVLQTSRLGDNVGRTLGLEAIMRWTPAVRDGQRGPVQTGLFKIRGVAVEALIGAIYHQHGAAIARSFFHAQILPEMETLDEAIRSELSGAILKEAESGTAVLQAMADRASSSNLNVNLTDSSLIGQEATSKDTSASMSSTMDVAQKATRGQRLGNGDGGSGSKGLSLRAHGGMPTADKLQPEVVNSSL